MVSLRPYQEEAVKATLNHFRRQATPALIVLPTGAGKSLVIAELARLARGRVLVLAHVKELVEQNHDKYQRYGLTAGIYSAGLERKDCGDKVIFGSIQSVARAQKGFFNDFSLLIIDECHRVSTESDTQYLEVIEKLRAAQANIRILGLTATPYRMGLGWIYQYSYQGILRSQEDRFFKKCIYDLPLSFMIKNNYLTPPIKIDAPVAQYDFSSLFEKTKGRAFSNSDIEDLLKDQKRVTPVIVDNIIELSHDRQGVMIFSASVRHAQEILALLPSEESVLIVGETSTPERDLIIARFKERKIKFLVNVSVLTTGFDAPHVDVIAVLRPTESVSLYQQIVGRGLRLSDGKKDCLILDYTGCGHDIFKPEVGEEKPHEYTVPVTVPCPLCGYANLFWGILDPSGELIEHFGRKCQGATEDPLTFAITPCEFRFRFKLCDRCQSENDIAARLCHKCNHVLVDDDKKLREAMALKDAYVMRPDEMHFQESKDRNGNARLEVRYYDLDGKHLNEYFYFDNTAGRQTFYYNFLRMHLRLPEKKLQINSVKEAISQKKSFRLPLFVIARKQKHYWIVREKIF
jgi:DNA repair protein RadD